MMNLRIILRQTLANYINPWNSATNLCLSTSSSSSSSSDDENKKTVHKKKSAEALEKLNLLLTKMIKEDTFIANQNQKLELARPVDKRRKYEKTEGMVDPVKQMLNAVKDVAKVVGGDVKQTESELLQKLLNPIKEETTAATTTANNLSEIFKDMKIDRETKPSIGVSRAHQVRQLLQSVKTQKRQATETKGDTRKPVRKRFTSNQFTEDHIVEERVNLFGNEGLCIFKPDEVSTWPKQTLTKTWNALEERELQLAVTHPPANYFQQMIQWTDQGKIWKFPIDNEQGMDAERSIYFTEHVFLEKHIESWCPPKGPISHFMELVLVGLSKNPYLSVEHKKEHIEWFKNYFNEKKELLHEVAAIPPDFEFIKDDSNKIEA